MILTQVPVIPPESAPGSFRSTAPVATSDLNDLYRRVINRTTA